MINIEKLLDKCECMTLLCTRTATYWSYVKMCFNIPLVFTSSAMCIINSISTDANVVKIPNIVVNAVSVLIMSLSNSIKSSEKFEIFKKLSQQFMLLSLELEALEPDDENIKEKLNKKRILSVIKTFRCLFITLLKEHLKHVLGKFVIRKSS